MKNFEWEARLVRQALPAYLERFDTAFQRISRALAARASGGTGLSPSQRVALLALRQGPLQVSEVANALGVTLSAATGLVDRLARYKMVSRERDLHDRRVVWVKLTAEGRKVLAETEKHRQKVLADIIDPLSDEELTNLCDILDRMTGAL